MTDERAAAQATEDEERRATEERLIAERNAAQHAADDEAGAPREQALILEPEGDATAAKGFPGDQDAVRPESTADRAGDDRPG